MRSIRATNLHRIGIRAAPYCAAGRSSPLRKYRRAALSLSPPPRALHETSDRQRRPRLTDDAPEAMPPRDGPDTIHYSVALSFRVSFALSSMRQHVVSILSIVRRVLSGSCPSLQQPQHCPIGLHLGSEHAATWQNGRQLREGRVPRQPRLLRRSRRRPVEWRQTSEAQLSASIQRLARGPLPPLTPEKRLVCRSRSTRRNVSILTVIGSGTACRNGGSDSHDATRRGRTLGELQKLQEARMRYSARGLAHQSSAGPVLLVCRRPLRTARASWCMSAARRGPLIQGGQSFHARLCNATRQSSRTRT
jgi:hypothetical protein